MAYGMNLLFNSQRLIPTFYTNIEVYYSQHSDNGNRNNSKMLLSIKYDTENINI